MSKLKEIVLDNGTILGPTVHEFPGHWNAQVRVKFARQDGSTVEYHGAASVSGVENEQLALAAAVHEARELYRSREVEEPAERQIQDLQAHWSNGYMMEYYSVVPS